MDSRLAGLKVASAISLVALACGLLIFLACHGPHNNAPNVPNIQYQMIAVSGMNQTGQLGKQLPTPLGVFIGDEAGVRQVGVYVNFKIQDGTGTLSPTNTASVNIATDTSGIARTYLTPTETPGALTVRASYMGLVSVDFTCVGM